MREVELVAAGNERVEVVAADPPLHLGKARLDLVHLACAELQEVARERQETRRGRKVGEIGRDGTEMCRRTVGEHGVDRQHVFTRVAVAQRARPAGIVAHHAADGGARGGRDVDWEPQPMRLEPAVELVENDAGLDHTAPAGHIELDQVVEIFRAVDDERGIDCLPRL